MELTDATATELLGKLASRACSAVELTRSFLDRIARTDSSVGAFLSIDERGALASAAAIDRRRAAGGPLGPLAGIPVAVKDVFCGRGVRSTCGSRMLADFHPPYDATLVARLRAADAILIGRTNMDEFAMGSSTENSAFHPTRNPWDIGRVPGGSSGGSAACLAARQAPLAIGTDTGGSIRQPAAFCGVIGLKPTYGRVSRHGLVAFASSLDQAGPMARTAEDTALLLGVIAGHDPSDSTSARVPVSGYRQALGEPLNGLRLGVVRGQWTEGVERAVASAIERAADLFRELGAELVDVDLPHHAYGIAAYYVIAPCEASSNLARYDGIHVGYRAAAAPRRGPGAAEDDPGAAGDADDSPLIDLYRRSRTEGFGLEVKRRVMLGTFALSAGYQDRYYVKALRVRRLIREDYDAAFQRVDLLIGPTTPTTAYRIGERSADPLAMYLGENFTVGANLAGLPAISVPCGADGAGLPIGFQLHAPPFQEESLLRAAHQYQSATDWHSRGPELE